jgi:hypothetical protein
MLLRLVKRRLDPVVDDIGVLIKLDKQKARERAVLLSLMGDHKRGDPDFLDLFSDQPAALVLTSAEVSERPQLVVTRLTKRHDDRGYRSGVFVNARAAHRPRLWGSISRKSEKSMSRGPRR